MKKIIVLILIILLTSFSFGHKIKIGTYRSVNISKIEQLSNYIFKGINYIALGSEIKINSDFTFRYVTCGSIIEGFWSEKNDSLLLNVKTHRWRNDSLNVNGLNGEWPKVRETPYIFIIKNDYIESIDTLSNGEWILERLKFVNP